MGIRQSASPSGLLALDATGAAALVVTVVFVIARRSCAALAEVAQIGRIQKVLLHFVRVVVFLYVRAGKDFTQRLNYLLVEFLRELHVERNIQVPVGYLRKNDKFESACQLLSDSPAKFSLSALERSAEHQAQSINIATERQYVPSNERVTVRRHPLVLHACYVGQRSPGFFVFRFGFDDLAWPGLDDDISAI